VLVEGGAEVLGTVFDSQSVDEVHAFIAPSVIGGRAASPVGGEGLLKMADALRLLRPRVERLGADVYVHGRFA
jgi:diaminohydroxyphosphoribosylaminopyrimidine deaminase/5-amino-6-(5-phosphoribosylamino)uracil reductase